MNGTQEDPNPKARGERLRRDDDDSESVNSFAARAPCAPAGRARERCGGSSASGVTVVWRDARIGAVEKIPGR